MRAPVAAFMAMLTAVSAFAQDKLQTNPVAQPQTDSCSPVASLLAATPASTAGRLFILDGQWKEIQYNWLGTDYTLDNYRGGQLAFVYAAPPPNSFRGRQFLSVRTVAHNDSSTNFVNLRKRRDRKGSPFIEDQVHIGRYQNYHRDGKPSGILTFFHTWFDGSHSDDPPETRTAWAFEQSTEVARRRVLAISYVPNESRITCARFWLGPNIAAPNEEDASAEGYDQVFGPFTIEISEAKSGTGTAGRTFKIKSVARAQ